MKTMVRAGLIGALVLAAIPVIRAEEPAAEAYTWGVHARWKEMEGDIDGAIADYSKAIAVYPQDPQPFNARAALKKQQGDLAGAIADYDKAIALNPKKDAEIIYANRGSARQENGDDDGALADYNQVLVLKPDYSVIYNNRALIRETKGDLDGALADFDKAIALQPDEADFYSNRAAARQAKGDLTGATADFDKPVALDPKRPMAYYERARFRRNTGDLDGAITDFSQVCTLAPKASMGYFSRGVTQQVKGDLEAAVSDYDKAMAAGPDFQSTIWPFREIALRQLHRGTPFAEMAKTVAGWTEGWSKSTGLYLIEALPERDYFAKADQGSATAASAQRCGALYFAGMTRLLTGDEAAARGFFEQCVATKQPNCDEFILARAEVARLAKKS